MACPIRPNTDTALMLGLAHTLVVENRHDVAFPGSAIALDSTRFWSPISSGKTDGTAQRFHLGRRHGARHAHPYTSRSLARRMAAVRTMLTVSWSCAAC